ncbi:hypothetical protein ACWEQP_32335 [Streptomyces sp. NPDC004044]
MTLVRCAVAGGGAGLGEAAVRRGAGLAVVAYACCGEGLVEAVDLSGAEMQLRGDPGGEQARALGSG